MIDEVLFFARINKLIDCYFRLFDCTSESSKREFLVPGNDATVILSA